MKGRASRLKSRKAGRTRRSAVNLPVKRRANVSGKMAGKRPGKWPLGVRVAVQLNPRKPYKPLAPKILETKARAKAKRA